ncbi:Solitary outer membrane autotransporter beta-barrel domain [Vibrio ziniensis]|uniref:Solitary outer membrane autotransporter beta-barrel domain n=1 Tax=Vibrio ziniensis TaxID=2711221 RepID=UPI001FE33259|nr:Solitary outer membrane autotransporter beta-barrel domain [Vibrio ziniensis]
MLTKNLIQFSVYLLFFPITAYAKGYDFIETFLEQSFAYTVVLSDSDVFTVGIKDFNPNELFNTDNPDLGTEDSLANRKKYAISTLPMSFQLNNEEDRNKHQLFFRLSGLGTEEKVRWGDETVEDDFQQVIADFYTAYRYEYKFDDHWRITPGFGVHLMRYENTMDYNSATGKSYAPIFDGLLFNTTAWSNIYEPHLKLTYSKNENWGKWQYSAAGHYFYGYGWGEANEGEIGNSEGWYIVNSATIVYNIEQIGRSIQSVYSTVRRVDVGSDVSEPLGTSFYYEATVGWLMTPPFEISFVDNIGLGLTFNYGSAFKGGSLVLFFNQD